MKKDSRKKKPKQKVMVFGVFDSLHDGHRYFLHEAKKQGDYLVVVVARDSFVKAKKNQEPVENEENRLKNLLNEHIANEVVLGDKEHGSWQVLKTYKPNIIVLGYDQNVLKESLEKLEMVKGILLVQVSSHEPHRFKSSLFRRENKR